MPRRFVCLSSPVPLLALAACPGAAPDSNSARAQSFAIDGAGALTP